METVNPQKAHYEAVHEAYADHYYDGESLAYRRKFIMQPLLEGIEAKGWLVADLACGSGYNSLLLREMKPGLELEGFDISDKAAADYRRLVGPAHVADLTLPFNAEARFDAVLVVGGLHHCVANLPQTLANIAGLVKPGGYLLMAEPNKRYILQFLRSIWYRRDRYFDADTEEALDHAQILGLGRPWFEEEKLVYLGGPAYFLVLNSLILRLPKPVKSLLAPVLMGLERVYNALPLPGCFYPVFCARWKRTEVSRVSPH